MQNWDRLAMLVVGALVSLYAGIDGYRWWRKGRKLAVIGVALLILAALAVPLALALFSS